MTKAFPYHDDCYTWPQVAVVHDKFGAAVLNVHCLRDTKRRQFGLVGFIGCDRQVQIDHVAWLADIGAETIVIKGRGLNDQIVSGLMSQMVEPDPEERPSEWCTFIPVDWPNKTQRRVLRKLYDAVTQARTSMRRSSPSGCTCPSRRFASTFGCWPTSGWCRKHDDRDVPPDTGIRRL